MNIPKIEAIKSLARGDDNISFIKVLNLMIYHDAAHHNGYTSYRILNEQYENAIMQKFSKKLNLFFVTYSAIQINNVETNSR